MQMQVHVTCKCNLIIVLRHINLLAERKMRHKLLVWQHQKEMDGNVDLFGLLDEESSQVVFQSEYTLARFSI
jgi:hypothetical protein